MSSSHSEARSRQKERYKKVTRLSSNQWISLGLNEGENSITFSVTTQYQVSSFFLTFMLIHFPLHKIMTKTFAFLFEINSSLISFTSNLRLKFQSISPSQGTAMCNARIFLWNYSDSIVISDIDGTITRSDVFGQILPYVGKDWSQEGVTNLFSNIERNGYRFVYLSARAIGQVRD